MDDSADTPVDTITCSVSANGLNGQHTASIEMDLDQSSASAQSEEIQVFQDCRGITLQNGLDFMDSNDWHSGGRHVGTIAVKAIDDPDLSRQSNDYINVNVWDRDKNTRRKICTQRDSDLLSFKKSIQKNFDVAPSQQRLIWNERQLNNDSARLDSYGIQDGGVVNMTQRLRGG